MIRFVFNVLGSVLLAVGLVFAVADIARSLADDGVVFTPLGQALASIGMGLEPVTGRDASAVDFIALVSVWPASVVAAIPALVLLFAGRSRRRRHAGRLAR